MIHRLLSLALAMQLLLVQPLLCRCHTRQGTVAPHVHLPRLTSDGGHRSCCGHHHDHSPGHDEGEPQGEPCGGEEPCGSDAIDLPEMLQGLRPDAAPVAGLFLWALPCPAMAPRAVAAAPSRPFRPPAPSGP
ncbi:MAG: hypothetical protein K2W96_08025, partial [Gemmataceae bacterium]|nr:hypothetical protein [Gemmataceae bacterium]